MAIDEAIMAGTDADALASVQDVLAQGDVLVKEARLGQQLDRKASLLSDAIGKFQEAWEAALGLAE